jgi:UDP-N-acetylmuramoyl-L-alanyl-D-glutamate--2,6-diaminopimelate ligase
MQKIGVVAHFKTSVRAHAAAFRYGRPSRKMQVVLVVGQDGSVGTVAFLASILRASGAKAGVITQHYVQIGEDRVQGSDQADINGDAFRLQGLLAQIKRAKCKFALIEVPQELPAHQFAGLEPSMVIVRRCGDNYIDQMTITARLSMLSNILARHPEFIVFNKDDPCSGELSHLSGQEGVISFGTHTKAECRITNVELHPKGSVVNLLVDHQTAISLTTELAGHQAIYNAAAAASAAYVLRMPIEAIEKGVRSLPPQPGQFEYMTLNRPYQVVLDAAASPGGLAETLETLKHFAKNRLIVVLGVPLGTPQNALPQLGEIANTYADRLIICDGEYAAGQNPEAIRAQLLQGVAHAGGEATTEEIPDRQAAIEKATAIARRGDVVVVVAVTQHPYRQLGDERVTWSDRKIIEELLTA